MRPSSRLLIETTRIDPVAATAVAFAAAFAAGFVLNRRWTFGSRAAPAAQLPRYLAAQLAGLALSAAIMHVAVHLQRWSPYAGLALPIALVPPVTSHSRAGGCSVPSDRGAGADTSFRGTRA